MSQRASTTSDAVFLYMGILDAYEAISEELIGEDVLIDEVLPRMIYYVRNFLPNKIRSTKEDKIIEELKNFIEELRENVYAIQANERLSNTVSIEDIWELRAAIFGFENVFIDILGTDVIESYVNPRIAEILGVYLPSIFTSEETSLQEKLDQFSSYIQEANFVKDASFSIRNGKVEYRVNRCAFARIHGSKAYLDGKTRFCPWGMISSAIISRDAARHEMKSCKFTTRGSITQLEIIGDEN